NMISKEMHHHHHLGADDERGQFWLFVLSAIFTLPLILQMVTPYKLPGGTQFLLASVVQFWCGRQFYRASYFSALHLSANMDLLIVLGTSAAYVFSTIVYV